MKKTSIFFIPKSFIAHIIEELSIPPLKQPPIGTSEINLRLTELKKTIPYFFGFLNFFSFQCFF